MTVLRKLRTLRRMRRDRRRMLMEAAVTLAYVRVWLAVTPFQKAGRSLGRPGAATAEAGDAAVDAAARREAREVGWAVRLAAARVPFRAVCLQQAVAGKLMLRRRGIAGVIHFGLSRRTKPEDKMEAHAWLDAGSARLTGYPLPLNCVEVARFD